MNYEIDAGSSEPSYKQLSGRLIEAIIRQELKPGSRLPSEASFSLAAGVSKGTIRKVYGDLECRGYVKRVVGSGTYVQERGIGWQQLQEFKEEALAAGFTTEEAFQMIRDACRFYFGGAEKRRAAILDCTPEIGRAIAIRLHSLFHMETFFYQVDDVLDGRTEIGPEINLWITTKAHYQEVSGLAEKQKIPLAMLQIFPAGEVVKRLEEIDDTCFLGILYESQEFIKHISHLLASLCKHNTYFLCSRQEWEAKRRAVAPEHSFWIIPAYTEEKVIRELRDSGAKYQEFDYEIQAESLADLEKYL